MSFIDNIKNWFGEFNERRQIVKDFNSAAKFAFLSGESPTLIKAKITIGEYDYRHEFSKLWSSGFEINVLTGNSRISTNQMKMIGEIVVGNEYLCRNLIANGFDTLYVFRDGQKDGLKFNLSTFAKIGKALM